VAVLAVAVEEVAVAVAAQLPPLEGVGPEALAGRARRSRIL